MLGRGVDRTVVDVRAGRRLTGIEERQPVEDPVCDGEVALLANPERGTDQRPTRSRGRVRQCRRQRVGHTEKVVGAERLCDGVGNRVHHRRRDHSDVGYQPDGLSAELRHVDPADGGRCARRRRLCGCDVRRQWPRDNALHRRLGLARDSGTRCVVDGGPLWCDEGRLERLQRLTAAVVRSSRRSLCSARGTSHNLGFALGTDVAVGGSAAGSRSRRRVWCPPRRPRRRRHCPYRRVWRSDPAHRGRTPCATALWCPLSSSGHRR